jgi:hypothetical protein
VKVNYPNIKYYSEVKNDIPRDPIIRGMGTTRGIIIRLSISKSRGINLHFVLLLGHKHIHQLWVPLLSKP